MLQDENWYCLKLTPVRMLMTSVPFPRSATTPLVPWPPERACKTDFSDTGKPYGLLRLYRTAQRQRASVAGQSTLTLTGDPNCIAPGVLPVCCGRASTRNSVGGGLVGGAATVGARATVVVVAAAVVVVVGGRGSGSACTADALAHCVAQ